MSVAVVTVNREIAGTFIGTTWKRATEGNPRPLCHQFKGYHSCWDPGKWIASAHVKFPLRNP